LRDGCYAGIVARMAEQQTQEITAEDVQGLKLLRRIGPLLSSLRKVGTKQASQALSRRRTVNHRCRWHSDRDQQA